MSGRADTADHDVIIVGGGAAGLSAALVLGRCGRKTVVCDDGKPRNAESRGVHGFVTRDGIRPDEFLRIGRAQVLAYPSVTFVEGTVTDADRSKTGFVVTLGDGRQLGGRKLLLATGLIDELPEIDGMRRFWARSVFICPFCDAWEVRGQRIAIFGRNEELFEFAVGMLQWSDDLVVCTDGVAPLDDEQRRRLGRLGMEICERKLARLEGRDTQLERLRFEDGSVLACQAMFVVARQRQRSSLPEKMGCPPEGDGQVPVTDLQKTRRRGVFVAGNAAKGLQSAILAAAEGFKAAYAINDELIEELIEKRCRKKDAAAV